MLTKRIIPCLDIKDGRTVKGVNFIDLKDAGDPVELGAFYVDEGADELVFLDITATNEKRKTYAALVRHIAENINIPFTVGGGINSLNDVETLLSAGADKISINSAAVRNPVLITELAKRFGSQCIVLAIDAKNVSHLQQITKLSNYQINEKHLTLLSNWEVYLNGGRQPTGIDAKEWAIQAAELGAGEILLTSMDNDGTKDGFAIDITRAISGAVNIPVIASGGAGNVQHFLEVFNNGKADAALAASIFHFKEINIKDLKLFLKENEINIRI